MGVHFYKLEAIYKEKIAAAQTKQEQIKIDKKQHNINQYSADAGISNVYELIQTLPSRRYSRDYPIIMICDNDDSSRKLAGNVLEGDYSLVYATTGQNAITKYMQTAPDVLFLDIASLPDMGGHELLDYIIQMDKLAYVIMFSCNRDNDKSSMIKAIEAGAKGFIKKPFTSHKLHEHIQKSPLVGEKRSRGTGHTKHSF